ncbi:hydantoin racemase [Aspergillus japonicus CBS 114.51]|uniref:Hydantoin racemase n=3 Tax=Aspergillus TaxID=5052 RepID=A0A2V5HI59_ASPV1|nr:hydantoin racemase [Aspergillus japonicus CBS 114.51]PYI21594.1 hydantoin racemase [Aspergillus violaceofuscus CBS 115571]PYI32419.1 hydantoin racemase [Aspergillus indologenus CBS 114.80]RAH80739.1 hydantoin racemase [Aspergillus japonicus CBS 114.51]
MSAPSKDTCSILVINPNTSSHMTNALIPLLDNLGHGGTQFDYFTAPVSETVTLPDGRTVEGVPSIDSGEDSVKSALYCMPFLERIISEYDGFLVCCFSAHPLVGMLKEKVRKIEESHTSIVPSEQKVKRKYVTGIFEAGVLASLGVVSSFQYASGPGFHKSLSPETFGIISTGKIWETELSSAVADMLGHSSDGSISHFAGVETTGLTAVELHTTPPQEVRRRLVEATERLLKGSQRPVGAICMGCAGMVGMEEAVREGCVRAYGRQKGCQVRIIDGVAAGAGMLVTACKVGY